MRRSTFTFDYIRRNANFYFCVFKIDTKQYLFLVWIPVISHKTLEEVSMTGNYRRGELLWCKRESTDRPKGDCSCAFWSGCSGHLNHNSWLDVGWGSCSRSWIVLASCACGCGCGCGCGCSCSCDCSSSNRSSCSNSNSKNNNNNIQIGVAVAITIAKTITVAYNSNNRSRSGKGLVKRTIILIILIKLICIKNKNKKNI